MFRLLVIGCIVSALMCPCLGLAAGDQLRLQRARIVADWYEFDEIRRTVTARGDVTVEFDGRTVTADSIECRLAIGEAAVAALEAAGSISFSEARQDYRLDSVCETLLYTAATDAEPARAVLRGARLEITTKAPERRGIEGDRVRILARAEEIELVQRNLGSDTAGRQLTVRDGWITTCDRPRPHYRIRAKELTIFEGDYVWAKGAAVQLGGLKMPSLPSVRFHLREVRRTSFFPLIGLNTASGAFLRWNFDLASRPKAFRLVLQASQKRSPSWGVEGTTAGNPRLFWTAAARQDTRSTRKRGLTVSRNPQVGLEYDVGKLFTAAADWGRFREFPGRIESERTRLTVDFDPIQLFEAGRLAVHASGMATRGWYVGGYNYRASSLNLQTSFDLGGGNSLLLGYVMGSTNRDTPFFFDDLDILRELQAGFAWSGKSGAIEFIARYDLDDGSFFGYRAGLSINYHCLRPRISYDSRDREFRVEMSLAGF